MSVEPARHPLLDPELAASLPASLAESLTPENLVARREHLLELLSTDDEKIREGGRLEVEERLIPGPEGGADIPLVILRPQGADRPLPCVYHIHGGGMVLGNNRVGLGTMIEWMSAVDLVVVSVGYRLAPEHPYPAGVEDCYAGLVWVGDHAAELMIDPSRLVIAGASAGGGLAAATALLARDRGGPPLARQILMCPMLDDRHETASSTECDGTGTWSRASSLVAWTAVLGAARGGPDVSPYAAPARAEDLSGLPPTFLDVGTAEILRDEDIAYATRLLAAGVAVELHVWPGGFHGFDVHAPSSALARACRETRIAYLKRVLDPNRPALPTVPAG